MNHRFPSGPTTMSEENLKLGSGNSVTTPAVVMRPILLPLSSANHRFPSGPVAMPPGRLVATGRPNSVIAPAGVIRAILPT